MGGRLALFALAVQFVLSFGHIHRDDIYGPSYGRTDAATIAAAASPDKSPSNPASPSSTHGDDYCAICATVSLLSNSFVAAAPQLPVPVAVHVVDHVTAVVALAIPPRRVAFQSRAPPTA
jgi:hypothetical protein